MKHKSNQKMPGIFKNMLNSRMKFFLYMIILYIIGFFSLMLITYGFDVLIRSVAEKVSLATNFNAGIVDATSIILYLIYIASVMVLYSVFSILIIKNAAAFSNESLDVKFFGMFKVTLFIALLFIVLFVIIGQSILNSVIGMDVWLGYLVLGFLIAILFFFYVFQNLMQYNSARMGFVQNIKHSLKTLFSTVYYKTFVSLAAIIAGYSLIFGGLSVAFGLIDNEVFSNIASFIYLILLFSALSYNSTEFYKIAKNP